MSDPGLISRMRALEADHAPEGWPAVQMRDITALCDALEHNRQAVEISLGNVQSLKASSGSNVYDAWAQMLERTFQGSDT